MRIRFLFVIATILLLGSSCAQLRELQTFTKCKFRVTTLENTQLAGVSVQGIKKMSDVKLLDAAKITAALVGGKLPLSFTLNIEAQNPNAQTAALSRTDWIVLIDDVQIATGTSTERVAIAPNSTETLPLHIASDLTEVLSGKSKSAMLNFGLNLTGTGNKPSRVTIKIKPSIMVAGNSIAYPGYLTLSQTFGGK